MHAVYRAAQAILDHIVVQEIADGIFRMISGGIDKLKDDLNRKVTELIDPHYNGHPITYNHYLTDNVQKARSARLRRSFEEILKESLGRDSIEDRYSFDYNVNPFKLLNMLERQTEVDMERYGSELAVDYMQAYYKVSIRYGTGVTGSSEQFRSLLSGHDSIVASLCIVLTCSRSP